MTLFTPTSTVVSQPLAEKYRPRTWESVVGQPAAVSQLRRMAERGMIGGRAYWISGQSGTGKTTLGRLLAGEIADPAFVVELDAGELTAGRLREVESSMGTYGWGRGGRAYIVNEAHGLSRAAIRQLLVLLERLPSHVVFIFTTTVEGQQLMLDGSEDASPLLSRCVPVQLARRGLAQPFAEYVRGCMAAEGMDGHPVEWYVRLAKDCRNNCRAMFAEAEARALSGGE